MGRKRRIPQKVISKNLYRLLGPDLKSNIAKIESETGIAGITIDCWLNETRNPSIVNLEKVAKCIGFTLSEVFDERLLEESQPIPISSTHRAEG